MSMFHVGQRVVCVDISGANDTGEGVCEGLIYTISWVGVFHHPEIVEGPCVCVHLYEINRDLPARNGVVISDSPFPYSARRFRPVKDTSIEVFRKLLAPLPEKEDA